ncbi:hypothetical protein EVA_05542 [gut metagenome]|uniref:Uncharacterized protein n=1 Tax=gut metagenome TaxID=749906 RepID=J9GH52_9ZZZZ
MLLMCPSCEKGNLQICNRGTGEYPFVLFFLHMGQDQPLPIFVQHILAAGGEKLHSASWLPRLQKKVYLCIMAQGFKMAYPFHWLCNGFL